MALLAFVHRRSVVTLAAGPQEELRVAISLVCAEGAIPLQSAPMHTSDTRSGLVQHQNPSEWLTQVLLAHRLLSVLHLWASSTCI